MPLLVPTWNRYIAVYVGACVHCVELEIQFIRTSLGGHLTVHDNCSGLPWSYDTAWKIIGIMDIVQSFMRHNIPTSIIQIEITHVYLRPCACRIALLYICGSYLQRNKAVPSL